MPEPPTDHPEHHVARELGNTPESNDRRLDFLPSVGIEGLKYRFNCFSGDYNYNFYATKFSGLKMLGQLHQLKRLCTFQGGLLVPAEERASPLSALRPWGHRDSARTQEQKRGPSRRETVRGSWRDRAEEEDPCSVQGGLGSPLTHSSVTKALRAEPSWRPRATEGRQTVV